MVAVTHLVGLCRVAMVLRGLLEVLRGLAVMLSSVVQWVAEREQCDPLSFRVTPCPACIFLPYSPAEHDCDPLQGCMSPSE